MKRLIGSRGSQLALWQSEWAKAQLLSQRDDLEIDIEVIRTTGDANLSDAFSEIGSKGVFTKEVDEALLSGRTHFSVHSLKDLPTTLPEGLHLAAVSPRADVRDALCAREVSSVGDLPVGARVATSSLRRQALLRSARSDIELLPLRGNVDTRLKKLVSEGLDAIVLAAAGLTRLGLDAHITESLDPATFVPAAGQGVMAIVARSDDRETADLLSVIEDESSRISVTAEREALAELGGGCKIPFGAWARLDGGRLVVDGVVAHPERGGPVRARIDAEPTQAVEAGKRLAGKLVELGGGDIIREVMG